MAESKFDVVVVGGGPGGYVAAIRAAQLGMRTAVVEREHLGGVCLNWGCIPTKALLRSAEVLHLIERGREFGVLSGEVSVDLPRMVKRSRETAKQLNNGVRSLMRKNKVTVVDGHARLNGKGKLTVEKDGKTAAELTAQHIILATGARARTLPHLQPDGKRIWTYREAMVPESLPKSLLVVGSGAIGIEFASFFRSLGSEVTVVEMLDRVVPAEDEEISAFAHKQFEKRGMKLLTGTQVDKLEPKGDGVLASLKTADGKEQTLEVERVVLAIGIQGNVEDIGLEGTKVKVEKGHVQVDQWLSTDEPGVYAIGDVVGAPWLAHKASHEGVICVERIAGVNEAHALDTSKVPACTYCDPQIASVGLSEAKAREAGYEVKVGRFPFIGNGKAIALGETEGMVKTVFDGKTGELLGAHMVGAEVTELIQGYGIARTLEATELDLIASVFPHPTLSEMMHESVLDAYGRAIHF